MADDVSQTTASQKLRDALVEARRHMRGFGIALDRAEKARQELDEPNRTTHGPRAK